jgi:xanthine dehydrogenase accessory factor
MRDVFPDLERWVADGVRVATATVVTMEHSARLPGAVPAVSKRGDVARSVTGRCVEPAVYEEARRARVGGPPRLVTYASAARSAEVAA